MPKTLLSPSFRTAVKRHGDDLDQVALRQLKTAGEPSGRTNRPKIEWLPSDTLRPDPTNSRKHSRQQIRKIERDIRKNGFINPILATQDNEVIAGHARLEASKLAGLTEVPVIRLTFTKAQAKARNIWDNKSTDLSQFDRPLLSLAMQELSDLDIDIEDTGFSVGEADLLIAEVFETHAADEEVAAVVGPAISKPLDAWNCGSHRIVCADAQDPASYALLMEGLKAHAAFTDVPYNLAGHEISGKGKVKHASFQMAAGEMSTGRYRQFLAASMKLMASHSADGALHYHCIDWRHLRDIQAAADPIYHDLLNICVWVKPNGGMGSLYRSRHEFVLVYKHGRKRHRNNVDLGRYGRNRNNVWEYAGGNSFSGRITDEGNLLQLHPTVKPVQMIADAILDSTARGEIVLDPFLGSGSTLIAAERTGRRCFGIDIDPLYVDVAIRRWQRHTGGRAIHAVTGHAFGESPGPRSNSRTKHSSVSERNHGI